MSGSENILSTYLYTEYKKYNYDSLLRFAEIS